MIDSHAHLDDARFNYDRDVLIKNLKANGVDFVYNIGADLKSSIASVELANKYDNVHAVIGVHPHEAKTYSPEVEEKLIELSKDKKVRAIGEIGLDFYYDHSPRDVQREVFKRQIVLADKLKLPIVIHSRDASLETYEMVEWAKKTYDIEVLIHCFSQSVDMMKRYMKLNCYISLGGAVTFKNARVPKEVAKEVDIDRLLLETDCPYMTPVPFRGKRNEPMYVKYVAKEIAKIRGMDEDELVSITDVNTKRFYND
ncbi:TatD family hydrolase [Anaerosphaera multitolerans]|uniref:TatD family deoxyribonuclease n=1 Tax=Anaerosphaera multitolerans TaxID=2487351 RepID=A0A437S4G0_9FIRM|nr:TatD family hydrolase [Anaerosphaera multitolerans]RVU53899.1 TatD family deoxyribonuclease [Anaerosphaera multitolerans]